MLILEARKSQILENIEAAEKSREESEEKIKEYNKIIQDSKIEAKNYFNQTREKILKDINNKKENLDKEINEEIKKAEIEIEDLKNKAPEKINKIAIEISKDLIKQLTSIEVNNSSISAIVNDLSKKKIRINTMVIDATFWVAISFIIFCGGLIYLKIPQKINEILNKLILDIKNEIEESEKLRLEAKVLLDKLKINLIAQTQKVKKF